MDNHWKRTKDNMYESVKSRKKLMKDLRSHYWPDEVPNLKGEELEQVIKQIALDKAQRKDNFLCMLCVAMLLLILFVVLTAF